MERSDAPAVEAGAGQPEPLDWNPPVGQMPSSEPEPAAHVASVLDTESLLEPVAAWPGFESETEPSVAIEAAGSGAIEAAEALGVEDGEPLALSDTDPLSTPGMLDVDDGDPADQLPGVPDALASLAETSLAWDETLRDAPAAPSDPEVSPAADVDMMPSTFPEGAARPEALDVLVPVELGLEAMVEEADGRERAIAVLDAVARQVRSGEIVVSAPAGATPEAILASILATLLATGTQ